ncbi:MAG: DUF721 domain-containing protein [Acidimicrobiia bacterium]|nr:DUF721 domain-containing protein [Acidimicrobiia bacterium]
MGHERNDDRKRDGRHDDVDDLGLTRLGESLERFVDHLGAPPISILSQLHDRWPELVGPGLAAATRPVELLNGVLTVACIDAAWASQIGWMEAQIIRRFEATFGSETVQRVQARVDGRKTQ